MVLVCSRQCANFGQDGPTLTTAGAVDIKAVVRGGILLQEQALDRAAPRATTSRVLVLALEAACRACITMCFGSSAFGVMRGAAALSCSSSPYP